MQTQILAIVEKFAADANLSDHRVGMLLVRNGRLLERLRDPSRKMWPDTERAVIAAVERERVKRGLDTVHPASHANGPAENQGGAA